jgi:hypothetical protein
MHLAAWAPIATLALRSYAPRPPYDDLADRTNALVLACLGELVRPADHGEWPSPPDTRADDELSLRAVVAWLSVPRCAGWCLTLPDMTRIAGSLDLPGARTGGRRDALATLFQGAGRDAKVTGLLSVLDAEAARAQAHYGQLAARWPAWTGIGRGWAAQVARTRGFVTRLEALAATESAGVPTAAKHGSARD